MRSGSSTSTATVHLMEDDHDAAGEDPNVDDKDLAEMETMLADLQDRTETATELGAFDEDEAAEIVSVMIKDKRKSFAQSAQLKKDKEFGRGYRQGAAGRDGPLQTGSCRLTIAELKQRTRRRKCGRLKDTGKKNARVNPAGAIPQRRPILSRSSSTKAATHSSATISRRSRRRRQAASRSRPEYIGQLDEERLCQSQTAFVCHRAACLNTGHV